MSLLGGECFCRVMLFMYTRNIFRHTIDSQKFHERHGERSHARHSHFISCNPSHFKRSHLGVVNDRIIHHGRYETDERRFHDVSRDKSRRPTNDRTDADTQTCSFHLLLLIASIIWRARRRAPSTFLCAIRFIKFFTIPFP